MEIIQVILAKVGIAAHLKEHTVQAQHINGVGRNLHADNFDAFVHHHAERFLQLNGVRGGQLAFQPPVTDHVPRGANQPACMPGRFTNGFEQVAGGGFTLGSGNAGQAQVIGRMAVERSRYAAYGAPPVANPHLRHGQLWQIPLHNQRRRAIVHRLGRKVVCVKARSRNAEEKSVVGLFPAVAAHRADVYVHIPLGIQ